MRSRGVPGATRLPGSTSFSVIRPSNGATMRAYDVATAAASVPAREPSRFASASLRPARERATRASAARRAATAWSSSWAVADLRSYSVVMRPCVARARARAASAASRSLRAASRPRSADTVRAPAAFPAADDVAVVEPHQQLTGANPVTRLDEHFAHGGHHPARERGTRLAAHDPADLEGLGALAHRRRRHRHRDGRRWLHGLGRVFAAAARGRQSPAPRGVPARRVRSRGRLIAGLTVISPMARSSAARRTMASTRAAMSCASASSTACAACKSAAASARPWS